MIDLWDTVGGISVKRAKLLSEGKVWINTFRNDVQFRKWMLDLIRFDQLKARGVDEDENTIGFYSFVTSLINPEKKFNTHYTLEDSGDLYRSLFMIATVEYFEIDWDDEKIRDQEWWSETILGYTDENLEKISERYVEILAKDGFRLLSENL